MALTPTNTAPGKGDKDDKQDNVFLREVDDAVRRGNFESFAKRYGKWIIAIVVIGLLAFGGYIWWENSQQTERGELAQEYVLAKDKLANKATAAEGRKELGAVAKSGNAGYRAAALMTIGGSLEADGKDKEAAAKFAEIVKDDSLPKPYRDLALVRQTTIEYAQLKPQQVVDRLKPLVNEDNAFFGSAGELTALALIDLKREKEAGPLFARIAKSERVPDSIRARAAQMAGLLGIDALPSKDETPGVQQGDSGGEAKSAG